MNLGVKSSVPPHFIPHLLIPCHECTCSVMASRYGLLPGTAFAPLFQCGRWCSSFCSLFFLCPVFAAACAPCSIGHPFCYAGLSLLARSLLANFYEPDQIQLKMSTRKPSVICLGLGRYCNLCTLIAFPAFL